jgi:acyl carrier protein
MDTLEIEKSVKEVLASYFKLNIDQIHLDSNLRDDLGMDSFGSIELAFALEEKFGINIPDDRITLIVTVKDVIDYIALHAQKNDK